MLRLAVARKRVPAVGNMFRLSNLSSVTNEERARRYIEDHGFRHPPQPDERKRTDRFEPVNARHDDITESRFSSITNRDIPRVTGSAMSSTDIVNLLRDEGGGLDTVDLDISDKASFTNNLILCTGRSPAHVSALADLVVRHLRERDVRINGEIVVGAKGSTSDWAMVDAGSTVIHLLLDETRRQYDIETLWRTETETESD